MKITKEINQLCKRESRLAHALEAARILEDVMSHFYERNYAVSWDESEADEAASIKLEVDSKCDFMARSYLTTIYDNAARWGFVGEESFDNAERRKEFFWCVDPICGSISYRRREKNFGTSIALFHKGSPVLGVMNCPLYRWTGVAIVEPKPAAAYSPRPCAKKSGRFHLVVSANKRANENLQESIRRLSPTRVTHAESVPVKSMGVLLGRFDLFYGLPHILGVGKYNIWDVGATAAFASAGECLLTDAFGEPIPLQQKGHQFKNGIIVTRDESLLRRAVEVTKELVSDKRRIHAVPVVIKRRSSYFVTGLRCVVCGVEYQERRDLLTCPVCGEEGILDVLYDYDGVGWVMTREALTKNPDPSHWRYMPLLPVREPHKIPSLHVGGTPLYNAERLAAEIGVARLFLKDDGLNPTASLKDRASSVGVARALAEKACAVTCASTGNAASSLAGNAASAGLPAFIFVPERAPAAKIAQLLIFGAHVFVVEGSYEDAFRLSMFCAARFGFYNRNSGINPYLVEGKKTASLEICEQMKGEAPDYVFVAVGDGCTLAGVWKGFREMHKLGFIGDLPRIVGVQAEGACPVMKAWQRGRDMRPITPRTIADSIAVGTPRNWRKAVAAVRESGGFYISVRDGEILAAMKRLGNICGIFGEPAGVTGLAGMIKCAREGLIPRSATVATIVSGNGLKDVVSATRAAGEARRIPPDTHVLEKIITRLIQR